MATRPADQVAKAVAIVAALEKQPELYYEVARKLRSEFVFGPWQKDATEEVWRRPPAQGTTSVAIRWTRRMFQIPTPAAPNPPNWSWEVVSPLIDMAGRDRFFGDIDAAMAWTDKRLRENNCILAPGVIDG